MLFGLVAATLMLSSSPEEQLAKMSLEEKIGQILVVPVCPKRTDDVHYQDLITAIQTYHVGNLIVKQSEPLTQVQFLNHLQEKATIPLIMSADAEWGLAMRMSDTIAFPRNMTLGAIQDLSLIEELGREMGRQAKRVGLHINLAPVADVNNNANNPVIGMRSFGEDPLKVAERVSAIFRGMQESGIFACAKHFPGHGDTDVDSHLDLPVIAHTIDRLKEVEFVPFKQASDEKIAAIMSAHLYMPAIDEDLPTSLSKKCLDLAREELGFQGLIISDALNMKAISDRYSPEQIAILARKAGCDFLLYADFLAPNVDQILEETLPRATTALLYAYKSGELDAEALDQTVLKILRMKENIQTVVPEENLLDDLHKQEAKDLKKRLFQEAVTLIGEELQPVSENTAYLSFGDNDLLASEFNQVSPDGATQVVISIHQKGSLTEDVKDLIAKYKEKAIVCLFATPYLLNEIDAKTILVGYENDPDAQKAVLNVLRGDHQPKGVCPIHVIALCRTNVSETRQYQYRDNEEY